MSKERFVEGDSAQLKCWGLACDALQIIFQVLISSKVENELSAFAGLLPETAKWRLHAFFREAMRLCL